MSAYFSSTPKDPIGVEAAIQAAHPPPAIRQAARNNAYYIARLKQHLEDFDKDLAEWKASGEWKKDYKTWGAACEIALNMSRRHANRLISEHEISINVASVETGHSCPAGTDTSKAHESEMRMSLPTPEELMGLPAEVHAGPAPRPEPPKPVAEHKPRVRNDNGKPIWAMPVWKEAEELCGKLINRVGALNHLAPNKDRCERLRAALHTAFDEIQSWREITKHA
jgi:hypothetical protein